MADRTVDGRADRTKAPSRAHPAVARRGGASWWGARSRSGRLPVAACLLLSGVVMVGCTAAGGVPPAASSGPGDSPSVPSAVAAPQSPVPATLIRPGSVVDGFALGAVVECSGFVGSVPPEAVGCARGAGLAAAALDARAPAHAAIVATRAFLDEAEPGPIDVTGDASPSIPAVAGSGGTTTVFVFTLADGSVRAIAVRCSDAGKCVPSPRQNAMIDTAWSWGSVKWSPDGTALAAAAKEQTAFSGEIRLYDRTGRKTSSLSGFQGAWVDASRLVTLTADANGSGWSAWLRSRDGSQAVQIAGMADMVDDGRGSLALVSAQGAGAPSFRTWMGNRLSASRPGRPVSWSADGRLLAVFREDARSVTGTGGSTPARLEIVDAISLRVVRDFATPAIDSRSQAMFDPSGRTVATDSAVLNVADGSWVGLPPHATAVAWLADGRLVISSPDGLAVRTWDPVTGASSDLLPVGTQLATTDGDLVTVPSSPVAGAIALRGGGARSPDGTLRAWSPPATGTGGMPLYLGPAPEVGR